MGITVKLAGQGGSVLLEPYINELGWTPCYLYTTRRIYLGADSLPYVVSGLLKAVSDKYSKELQSGEIAGHLVKYVFVLAEAHHALYVAEDGQDRLLFWQDAHQDPVNLVGSIRLSPDQQRQWQSQLSALRDTFAKPARQAAITKEITEIMEGAEALK